MLKSSTKISDSRLKNHKSCIPKCGTGMKLWVPSPNIGARLSGFIDIRKKHRTLLYTKKLRIKAGLYESALGELFHPQLPALKVPRHPLDVTMTVPTPTTIKCDRGHIVGSVKG